MSDYRTNPPETVEDWYAILLRPGMNVLSTMLMNSMSHARSRLENPAISNSYDKVCEVRGEMMATRKVIQFIKSEYDRAAKGDTPAKEK